MISSNKLESMTLEPLLRIHLQAGLSALKTPFCYEEGCAKEDPLSQETFRKLAEPHPFAKHFHSKLVCYISKELMNEDNPPLVLPDGYVYSREALEEMAKANQGKITCPRTVLCLQVRGREWRYEGVSASTRTSTENASLIRHLSPFILRALHRRYPLVFCGLDSFPTDVLV